MAYIQGTKKGKPLDDLTGRKFGLLTVLFRSGSYRLYRPSGRVRSTFPVWTCQCECGSRTDALASNLRGGNTKSCGCLKTTATYNQTHAMSGTPEYISWCRMIERCYDTRHSSYSDYGGRGISVCPQWRHDPVKFYTDMGPSNGLQLDRWPNNDGNYEPGNCRWATPRQNSNNRRDNVVIEFNGIRLTGAEWARRLGVHRSKIY
jgi:hypothetical protein